ncbi:MAG TPA: hypothetical protein VJ722_01885, partial [Rhodanobacteraceae bacterium]|nr:hypothetical protein [Rhodanobacteraceae bacterium]
ASHPALTHCTDTPGLIDACAGAGVLPERDARILRDAHAQFLALSLNCTLDSRPRVVPRDDVAASLDTEVLRIARAAGFDFAARG